MLRSIWNSCTYVFYALYSCKTDRKDICKNIDVVAEGITRSIPENLFFRNFDTILLSNGSKYNFTYSNKDSIFKNNYFSNYRIFKDSICYFEYREDDCIELDLFNELAEGNDANDEEKIKKYLEEYYRVFAEEQLRTYGKLDSFNYKINVCSSFIKIYSSDRFLYFKQIKEKKRCLRLTYEAFYFNNGIDVNYHVNNSSFMDYW